jgi:aspartyl-tRNA(Asn)/glutamyl-tRNA(Gln) amidotransferase subunit B
MNYDVVIGLEVHAQLSTLTKAWCQCEISVSAFENTKVCEVCSAQPGTLPVYNKKAIEYAIKLGLATNSRINKVSVFDRKNYFYPDLPKGYQITQFQTPVAENGHLDIFDDEGNIKKVGIQRIQMEEDTGKSSHLGEKSLINLNRSGTPLLEIVSEPHMSTAKEASSYLKKLHSILVYLGICHGNMQDGNFRCDVNVSIKPKGSDKYGTRTEVKNVNSFRHVEMCIEHEVQRHQQILDSGNKVLQQTLLFDVETKATKVLRTKSDADDYRYFPEPDLLPLIISDSEIQKVQNTLPELPDAKIKRFILDYGIPAYDANVLTVEKELANYFEAALKNYEGEAKKMSNWIMVELLRYLNEAGTSIERSPVSPNSLAGLLNAINSGKISGKQAKDVFLKMYDSGHSADVIIKEMGLEQISDEKMITEIAQKIINANSVNVEKYKAGNERVFGFFVGQVMKETNGQANPSLTSEIIKKLLS